MQPIKTPISLLSMVGRAHQHLASQVFEQAGLYRGQPPVLFELGEHAGILQTDLAEILEVTAATMTKLLQRMEAAGLIRRERDATDGRISRVYLTEAGRAARARATLLASKMNDEVLAGLSEAELATLTNLLDRIHTNLLGQCSAKRP